MGDALSPSVLYFDPKKSTENFARLCQFLLTICSDVMRDILCQHIKPANLRMELDKNISILEKITNKQEKYLLYPPHSSTSSVPPIRSKDLDISLLYKILRNLCNIPTHIAGWGNQPRPSDFSLAACIERIRILRNSISGHSTNGTVDDVKFEDYWRELRTSVGEIEKEVIGSDKYERGIDHLYKCDLNPTKSKECVDKIMKCSGELKVKRERIDLVEEEVKAKRVRLENLEQRQSILEESNATFKANIEASLTEAITAVKSDMLEGFKSIGQRSQQEKRTSSISNCGTDNNGKTSTSDTSTYTTKKSTTTTIKFKLHVSSTVYEFSMHVTRDNKCWLLVPKIGFNAWFNPFPEATQLPRLFLLSEVGDDIEIKIPEEYKDRLSLCNITVNDDGEAVFIAKKSLIAAGENGVVRKLFDIPDEFTDYCRVCFTRSGNYIVYSQNETFLEYSQEGSLLKRRYMSSSPKFEFFPSRFYQHSNEDFVVTGKHASTDSSYLSILNSFLGFENTVNIEKDGIITPVFDNSGHLLYGHDQSIDLLDSKGKFIKTIYKKHKHQEICNIAYSSNGTIWILYDTSEIEIFKLENVLDF